MVLLLLVVALVYQVYRQQSIIQAQRTLLAAPEPKGASLEYQEKCAQRSAQYYKENDYKIDDYHSFENHYNAKLNKCFIEIYGTDQQPDKTFLTSRTIFDAFEGKNYAQYAWGSEKDKKYWEVPPLICSITLPDGNTQLCKTEDEFTSLTKNLMEDH